MKFVMQPAIHVTDYVDLKNIYFNFIQQHIQHARHYNRQI
jgi:hypothetical protein